MSQPVEDPHRHAPLWRPPAVAAPDAAPDGPPPPAPPAPLFPPPPVDDPYAAPDAAPRSKAPLVIGVLVVLAGLLVAGLVVRNLGRDGSPVRRAIAANRPFDPPAEIDGVPHLTDDAGLAVEETYRKQITQRVLAVAAYGTTEPQFVLVVYPVPATGAQPAAELLATVAESTDGLSTIRSVGAEHGTDLACADGAAGDSLRYCAWSDETVGMVVSVGATQPRTVQFTSRARDAVRQAQGSE
jgi:hypothetical protein